MKRRPLRGFDLRQINGFSELIGVDEAGRGALAGPVYAAAVCVSREFLEGRWAQTRGTKVNDSKQLSAEERELLFEELHRLAHDGEIRCGIGKANVGEIETLNILGATKVAMQRALGQIYAAEAFQERTEPDLFSPAAEIAAFQPAPLCRILIDGVKLKKFPYPHEGVVHGDARSLCIAMASILAKESRDRAMVALDSKYRGYGFAQHKGYGTEEHREALIRQGRCFEHRETFVQSFFTRKNASSAGQLEMFS